MISSHFHPQQQLSNHYASSSRDNSDQQCDRSQPTNQPTPNKNPAKKTKKKPIKKQVSIHTNDHSTSHVNTNTHDNYNQPSSTHDVYMDQQQQPQPQQQQELDTSYCLAEGLMSMMQSNAELSYDVQDLAQDVSNLLPDPSWLLHCLQHIAIQHLSNSSSGNCSPMIVRPASHGSSYSPCDHPSTPQPPLPPQHITPYRTPVRTTRKSRRAPHPRDGGQENVNPNIAPPHSPMSFVSSPATPLNYHHHHCSPLSSSGPPQFSPLSNIGPSKRVMLVTPVPIERRKPNSKISRALPFEAITRDSQCPTTPYFGEACYSPQEQLQQPFYQTQETVFNNGYPAQFYPYPSVASSVQSYFIQEQNHMINRIETRQQQANIHWGVNPSDSSTRANRRSLTQEKILSVDLWNNNPNGDNSN